MRNSFTTSSVLYNDCHRLTSVNCNSLQVQYHAISYPSSFCSRLHSGHLWTQCILHRYYNIINASGIRARYNLVVHFDVQSVFPIFICSNRAFHYQFGVVELYSWDQRVSDLRSFSPFLLVQFSSSELESGCLLFGGIILPILLLKSVLIIG